MAFTQTPRVLRETIASTPSHLPSSATQKLSRLANNSTCRSRRTHIISKMLPPNFIGRRARGNTNNNSATSDSSTVHGLPAPQSRPQTRTSPRIEKQKTSHPVHRSTRPYVPLTQHMEIISALLTTHMVREAKIAAQSFTRRNEPGDAGWRSATLCVKKCYEVLTFKDTVSEAIVAWTRMILATDRMVEYAGSRAPHVKQACNLWNTVIARQGMSKYPRDKAKQGQV